MRVQLFKRLSTFWKDRKGTIALVIAMAAPLLIGVTALSVDVGFWYEEQESLQSAADAAALAAQLAGGGNAADWETAADAATSGQFKFHAGTTGATVSVATSTSGSSTIYTATASISRDSFFTPIRGIGFGGVAPGRQSASAAVMAAGGSPICTLVTSDQPTPSAVTGSTPSPTDADAIYEDSSGGGAGGINATGCGIFANSAAPSSNASGTSDSTACPADTSGSTNDAIVVGSSMTLNGPTVGTVGCADWVNSSGAAKLCNSSCTLTQNGKPVTDPYAGMANPPSWPYGATGDPLGASFPQPSSATTYTVLPYNGPLNNDLPKSNYASGTQDITCTNGTAVSGSEPSTCVDSAGNTVETCTTVTSTSQTTCSVLPSINVTTGKNYVLNQLTYQSGNGAMTDQSITFNASPGGETIISSGISTNAVNLTFDGTELYLTSGSPTSTPTTTTFGAASGYALSWSSPGTASNSINIGSGTTGTYYFQGGAFLAKSSGTATANFAQGTYFFQAASGSTNSSCGTSSPESAGAFVASTVNVNFTGGTYYFDGGFTAAGSSSATITFGPGIYYIENGALCLGTGPKIVADDATFVLEGNSFFVINASGNVTMTAPGYAPPDGTGASSCVSPANYATTDTTSPPYDGTGGKGICGLVIYQARSDTAEDIDNEGATMTVNGTIYAPDAELNLYGAGSMGVGTSGVFGLIVNDLDVSASGSITTEGSAGSYYNTSTATTVNGATQSGSSLVLVQ